MKSNLDIITKLLRKKGITTPLTLTTKFQDLDLDSLDLLDLVIYAEKKYNVRIPDESLLTIVTVQDLINLIEKAELSSG